MKNKNKNKGGFLFLLLIPLVLAGFFGFGKNIARASSDDIVINEIQISGITPDDEFIELYNISNKDMDLSSWSIQYKGGGGTKYSKKNFVSGNKIKSHGYFLIAHNSFSGNVIPDMRHAVFELSSEKTGAGGTIFLVKSQKNLDEITPDLAIIDKVGYGVANESESLPAWKPGANQSIERKNFVDTDNNHEDFNLPGVPSPQKSTPAEPEPDPEPKIYSNKIIINEIFPAPKTKNGGKEFVEIINVSNENIDLSGLRIEDEKNHKVYFPEKILALGEITYLEGNFELNNTTPDSAFLIGKDGTKDNPIDSVHYEHPKYDYSYAFNGISWQWTSKETKGQENEFDELLLGKIKKDKNIYSRVYANFEAKTDKKAQHFTWNFGDGHKSYIKKTRHKYEKSGNYKASLKITGDGEDNLLNFDVKVEKFPKSKIEILDILANPKGKDSGAEYITLRNKSKKKINLKDWSVATGSKKLYNHPISKDIFIKPGETLKLTSEFSKFTLNNTKSKVELRYPDGKVASKMAYDKKTKTVAENELYTKKSRQWAWVAPKMGTKLALAEKPLPVETSPQTALGSEASKLLADGKNFSEDESSRKIALANFTKPQGIVLGAATFKPSLSGTYQIQNKISYLEIVFTYLNSAANYLLNKVFFFFN